MRRGSGAVKHLSTKDLWVQEAIKRFGLRVEHIDRSVNVADSLASYSGPKDFARHLEDMQFSAFYFWN